MDKEIKCFYCSFNDPMYVKNEKLNLMPEICTVKNFEAVINEIKEYINEPDSVNSLK